MILLLAGLFTGSGCQSSPPELPRPATSPTELPAPAPLAAPPPPPSPSAAISADVLPSPIRPVAPESPTLVAAGPAASNEAGRARVANSEGQGANLRAEPSANAARVKTVPEGSELEVTGPDRDVDGRTWRQVRDPSDGAVGWIVGELLASAPASVGLAPRSTPTRSSSAPAAVTASPSTAPTPAISSGQARQIGDVDRAYLAQIQPHIDAIGTAIGTVNQQLEVATSRPAALEDAFWRTATDAAGASLTEAARRIRAARPGPDTGEVHERALRAVDRAEDATRLLDEVVKARDPRRYGAVRTALLRVFAEINAMNAALLQLQ